MSELSIMLTCAFLAGITVGILLFGFIASRAQQKVLPEKLSAHELYLKENNITK